MEFQIRNLSEEQAKQLCEWQYDGEYSVYNFVSWDTAVQQRWSITFPEKRKNEFRSVLDKDGDFIGFFRMTPQKADKIEIGLGLKPEYCGHGIGKDFVTSITDYTVKCYPNSLVYLEVRTFNTRAVKCYQSCGYTVTLQHRTDFSWGSVDYFLMEYSK